MSEHGDPSLQEALTVLLDALGEQYDEQFGPVHWNIAARKNYVAAVRVAREVSSVGEREG